MLSGVPKPFASKTSFIPLYISAFSASNSSFVNPTSHKAPRTFITWSKASCALLA